MSTTTLPPPPVVGWEGDGPSEISVDYLGPNGDLGVSGVVRTALRSIGLDREAGADTHLEVDVEISAGYVEHEGSPCYAGAIVEGSVALVDTTGSNPELVAPIDGEYPAPMVLLDCNYPNPEDAPFRHAFEPDFVAATVEWWAEGAAPYLASVLRADHYVFDARIEAIQALRLMDWDSIPVDDQYEVLDAALWFTARITHMSDRDSARTYRRAVEALFDESIDWEIEIPVTDDARADRFVITDLMRDLEDRY